MTYQPRVVVFRFPQTERKWIWYICVGRSSTSVSAALPGMFVASKYPAWTTKQHIAVIGDSALTGGMAFEGLNHAGVSIPIFWLFWTTIACQSIRNVRR